jgi:basic membrane protein A and related proteins
LKNPDIPVPAKNEENEMRKTLYFVIPILIVLALLASGCAPAAPATPAATAAVTEASAPTSAPVETEAPTAPPTEAIAPTSLPAETAPAETAPPEPAAKPVRIAALLPGRVDDMSFNQQLYEGLMRLQEKLGDKVEVTYTEGLYQVVDIEPALRDYADQGYDLIIGHGFQFQDPVMAVAPNYPDVNFALGPGTYMTAENVSTYDADNAQVGYLLGTVAGLVTKTKKVGSIGGVDVPNIHAIHEGFRIGYEAASPGAQVINLYTGDFRDAEAAREAALSMIDQGADIIFCSGDGMVVGGLEAAKDRNVLFLTSSDMSASAPDNFLASLSMFWDVSLEQMVNDISAGSYGGTSYALTLQNKGLELVVHLTDVTKDVQDQIDATVAGLTDGTITIPEIK